MLSRGDSYAHPASLWSQGAGGWRHFGRRGRLPVVRVLSSGWTFFFSYEIMAKKQRAKKNIYQIYILSANFFPLSCWFLLTINYP
jgi:hypothetical protein